VRASRLGEAGGPAGEGPQGGEGDGGALAEPDEGQAGGGQTPLTGEGQGLPGFALEALLLYGGPEEAGERRVEGVEEVAVIEGVLGAANGEEVGLLVGGGGDRDLNVHDRMLAPELIVRLRPAPRVPRQELPRKEPTSHTYRRGW
jgi:hypothetical protein